MRGLWGVLSRWGFFFTQLCVCSARLGVEGGTVADASGNGWCFCYLLELRRSRHETQRGLFSTSLHMASRLALQEHGHLKAEVGRLKGLTVHAIINVSNTGRVVVQVGRYVGSLKHMLRLAALTACNGRRLWWMRRGRPEMLRLCGGEVSEGGEGAWNMARTTVWFGTGRYSAMR